MLSVFPGVLPPCLIAACMDRVLMPRSAFRRCRCLVRINSMALVAVAARLLARARGWPATMG